MAALAAARADTAALSPDDLAWQGIVSVCPVKVRFSGGKVVALVDRLRGKLGDAEYAYRQAENGLITNSTTDWRDRVEDVEMLVSAGGAVQWPKGVKFTALNKRTMAYHATEFRYSTHQTVTRTRMCPIAVRT